VACRPDRFDGTVVTTGAFREGMHPLYNVTSWRPSSLRSFHGTTEFMRVAVQSSLRDAVMARTRADPL